MVKYKIRDKYAHLETFTADLPKTFDGMEGVLRDYRNVIKIVDIEGVKLVIKNFRGMYFFNRLAYSLFRKSKAVRSYEYSVRLQNNGIRTPEHVSWLNSYKAGLLTESFFVSVFCAWPTLEQLMKTFNESDERQVRILRELARFAHRLHGLGIYHRDFSAGNILVDERNGQVEFALLDLNRVRFGKVRSGVRNFSTLQLPPTAMELLLRAYAGESGDNPDALVHGFRRYSQRKSSLRKFRKTLRRNTLEIIFPRK